MDQLFPEIEPFMHGMLKVSPTHELYYEQVGNPLGSPVVFLHGGPGGGASATDRRFFDPKCYRAILFDQRGAGRSRPHASLEDNTTWDLVQDIERLREHLGIDRWVVFGGSWGSTLALAYAETHPERVKALVLRGIFLLRRFELEWFYQEGASRIFPEAFADYLAPIPLVERADLISAYYRRLTSNDREVRMNAARAWSLWEGRTSKLLPDEKFLGHFENPIFAEAFARIECHYFVHGAWFEHDDQLLRNVGRIRHIPATIIQGRYDVVCPAQSAFDLHQAWPEAKFVMVADAGHSRSEPGIARALVAATQSYADL